MSDDPHSPSHREQPPHSHEAHPAAAEGNHEGQDDAHAQPGAGDLAEAPQGYYDPSQEGEAATDEHQQPAEEGGEYYEGQYYYETGESYAEPGYGAASHYDAYEDTASASPAAREVIPVQPGMAKSIVPRQTARPIKRSAQGEQQAKSVVEPQDASDSPDSNTKLLALTKQLAELITNKKEGDAGADEGANAKVRRGAAFKQSGALPPSMRTSTPLAPLGTQPAPPGGVGTVNPPSRNSNASAGPRPAAPPPPTPAAFSGASFAQKIPWIKWIVLILLTMVVLTGMFAFGRMSAPNPTDFRKVARDGRPGAILSQTWSDADLAQLDQALIADQNGDFESANRIAYNLKSAAKQAPGLELYLANIESRRDNYNEAESILSQANGTQDAAALSDAFGFSFTRRRDFAKASQWLTRAVVENPFSADLFYRLGESLRRQGNLRQAVERFQQGLIRLPNEVQFDDLREWMGFKMRLAQLELGKNEELQKEVETRIAQPSASGYWLMIAAAIYMQGGDMTNGADMLSKAKNALGADHFNALMSDYFFRAYADRDQIAPFAKTDAAVIKQRQLSRTAYFVDP